MDTETSVVREWHDALNSGGADRLARLVHPDVEIGGPRGSARGVATLLDWAERTGIRLQAERVYKRGDVVVVEQQAAWRSSETGEVGEPQRIASSFVVRDGLVQQVARYDDLLSALRVTGLDERDEVQP